MANIILPQAKVLDTISDSATMLVEENGEIRRYNVTSLTEDFVKNNEIKATARNLLDNSDFTNPVNQRGLTTYTGMGYTIDRWILAGNAGEQNTMWISTDGYIGLSGGNTSVWLTQKIDPNIIPLGSKVTFAVKQNLGDIHILNIDSWGTDKLISSNSGITLIHQFGDEVVIYNGSGIPQGFNWAALYIGEYTVETLPEYQPKGYGAELLECMRYFQKIDSTYTAYGHGGSYGDMAVDILLPIEMRENPTVEYTLQNVYVSSEDKISQFSRVDKLISKKRVRLSPVSLQAGYKNLLFKCVFSSITFSADL